MSKNVVSTPWFLALVIVMLAAGLANPLTTAASMPEGPIPPAEWTLTGEGQEVSDFGNSVAGTNINGDYITDIIIGAPEHDGKGRVYVYYGSHGGPDSIPDWTADGSMSGAKFGYSVASAGDVNRDGYGDIIIGAPGSNTVIVGYGSPSGIAVTQTLTYPALGMLGYSVAGAGDVNGDGYGDIVAGAPGAGVVIIGYGSAEGIADPPQTLSYTGFGWSVAGAGDVNADGYGDVIAGAPTFNHGNGAALVYTGSPNGVNPLPTWEKEGNDGECFGWAVAGVGDIYGDGFTDIAVSAIMTPPNFAGRVDLFNATADGLPNTPSWSKTGSGSLMYLGSAVSGGDVNGDTHSDMLVGAPGGIENEAVLFFGDDDGLQPAPDWTVKGDDFTKTGAAVAIVGDIDDDGQGELAVGSPESPYPMAVGEIYLYNSPPVPISGLSATNNSPTILGQITRLMGHLERGSHVTWEWLPGDGSPKVTLATESSADDVGWLDHVYPLVGTYTATVTATNTLGSLSATTTVTITNEVTPPTFRIYLPVVVKYHAGHAKPNR